MKTIIGMLCAALLVGCTEKSSTSADKTTQISCTGEMELSNHGLEGKAYAPLNLRSENKAIIKKFTVGENFLILRPEDGSDEIEQRYAMCAQSPTLNIYSSSCKYVNEKEKMLFQWLSFNGDPNRKIKNDEFRKSHLTDTFALKYRFFYIDRTDLDLVWEDFLLRDTFVEPNGKKGIDFKFVERNSYQKLDGRFKCIVQSIKI
jgi:hypothetical protein